MSLTNRAAQLIELGRGGSYSVSRDAIKHTIYDTQIIPATVQDYTFFSQPVGSAFGAGVKSVNETNLYDNGKLPNGQTFLAMRFGIALISHSAAAAVDGATVTQAFTNIVQSSIFDIKLQGREFDSRVHGSQLTPAIAVSTISAVTVNQHGAGQYLASGWFNLDPSPIFIDQMVSFSVQRTTSTIGIAAVAAILLANFALMSTNNCWFHVRLEGFLTRAK
jgi:hypothetical protein